MGHFAKVCKSSERPARTLSVVSVLGIDKNRPAQKITCEVTSNAKSASCPVELVVDTGAAVSIIPEPVYREHFSNVPLTEPKVK